MTEDHMSSHQDGRGQASQPEGEAVPTLSPVATSAPAYAQLAQIVLGSQPLGAVLAQVAVLSRDLVPGVDEVSVTLIDRDRARSVAFSGQLAAALDERQYKDGYGPCMDAAVSGQIIAVEDTSTDTLYPEFAAAAARAGVRNSLSIGLSAVARGTVGALNLYCKGKALEQDARDAAAGFASYAAVALSNAAVHAGAVEEIEQMRTAMQSRATIEQAKGIIIATRRCSPDEAFDLLRDTSSRHNRKLRDIAQALVNDYNSSH
jgi:GAF domain-containing protein